MPDRGWTILIYKLPPQPTRLRIQVWRKLQALGAVYLQDGVACLPTREDLDENLKYVANSIVEMDGTAVVLRAIGLNADDGRQLIEKFRKAADTRMSEVAASLANIEAGFPEIFSFGALEVIEEELKRGRLAYLKMRRLNYCGSDREPEVEAQLDRLAARLAEYMRGAK